MRYIILIILAFAANTLNAQTFLPFLNEGKKWVFADVEIVGQKYDEQEVYTKQVDGDSIAYGLPCKRLSCEREDRDFITYGVAYEEDGRLYTFEEDYYGSYNFVPVLICDMNLAVGDSAWKGHVAKVDTIEVRGVTRRRITIDQWGQKEIWVEGIGSSTDDWPTYRAVHCAYSYIRECYDNGELVFTEDDFFADPVTNGITTPSMPYSKDNRVFDLQGRRVEKPLAGGIYVRHGRKFVQR